MTVTDPVIPRSMASRIGWLVPNLIAPGVALIRFGRFREGTAFLFGFPVALVVVSSIVRFVPAISASAYLLLIAFALLGAVFVLLASAIRAWRFSKFSATRLRWLQKWYALAGLYVLSLIAAASAVAFARSVYQPYFVSASSMEPTLSTGDQLVADMRERKVRRGDVVVVRVAGVEYVMRVAAIGGDRIALTEGVVAVNGTAVTQQFQGNHEVDGQRAQLFSERFPDERGSHDILNLGPSPVDDVPTITVPVGMVYLLGDNRDNSADSRMDGNVLGLGGAATASDIRGRVLFKTFDRNWRWLGEQVE